MAIRAEDVKVSLKTLTTPVGAKAEDVKISLRTLKVSKAVGSSMFAKLKAAGLL